MKYTRNKNQENKAQKEDINHSIEINQELTQISELAKNKQTNKKDIKRNSSIPCAQKVHKRQERY